MTQNEYWAEIEAIGKDLQENCTEDCSDYLDQAIDAHQWVIYNAYHLDVLRYSEHEEEAIEQGMVDDAAQVLHERGLFGLTAILAYYAMRADVYDWLADNPVDEEGCDSEQEAGAL